MNWYQEKNIRTKSIVHVYVFSPFNKLNKEYKEGSSDPMSFHIFF